MDKKVTIINSNVRELKSLIIDFYELILNEHTLIKKSLNSNKSLQSNELSSKVLRNRLELHRIYNSLLDDVAFVFAQNPVGKDLRRTLSYAQIAKSLERLGNYASTIAFFIINFNEYPKYIAIINKAFRSAFKNLADLEKVLLNEDQEKVRQLVEADDLVDAEYKKALKQAIKLKISLTDNNAVERRVKLIIALRAVERIGDHVTSICESFYYISTGKRIDVWNNVLE